MAGGLRYFEGRVGEGMGQPLLDGATAAAGGDREELLHVQPAVAIALGSRTPEPSGTLYITTKRVIWLSDTDLAKGYAVDFLSLSLHAVSRDPEAYPLPCIYAQIETENSEDVESQDLDPEHSEDAALSEITEMRLVPADPRELDSLFNIFCHCAELNPDPIEAEEEENEWVFGNGQMVVDGDVPEWPWMEELLIPIGSANGHHDLASSLVELQINDQRFEDAEDVEYELHVDRK